MIDTVSAVALIRQYYARASRNDFAGAMGLFADDADIAFVGPDTLPFSGTYRGREGIEQFHAQMAAALMVERFELRRFIDCGSRVVVIGRGRSTVRATGKTLDIGWVQVWRVNEGRITGLRNYFDTGAVAIAFA